MHIMCFLTLSFIIYAIIGIIAGSIFNKCKWKVDFKISPEKFGACWPKYVPKLIADLKTEKKQSNRNTVLDTLHNIGYIETDSDKNSELTSDKNSKLNVNTGLFTSLGLTNAYLTLNLDFKGKRYMVDINGNVLSLNLD